MSTQGTLPFRESQKAVIKYASGQNAPKGKPIVSVGRTQAGWLGLLTSHRRLFDASQDGWIRPLEHSSILLGKERFVSEDFPTGRNIVPIRLAFDVDKLPFPDVRKGLEAGTAGNDDGVIAQVVQWPAPIPLYAVKTIEVASIEEKARLLAMAKQTSNVALPSTGISVSDFTVDTRSLGVRSNAETPLVELPGKLNAIQGAIAMAIWAVPHVQPWIDVLRHALDRDAAGASERAGRLEAKWFQLPWLG